MERSNVVFRSEVRAAQRRPSLSHEEFDSNPVYLRENLQVLDEMLGAVDSDVRRRVRLAFGELVANWQLRYKGETIAVAVEVLPGGAVRMDVHRPQLTLTSEEWERLVSGVITGLVDAWGADRRTVGSAWFEFRHHVQRVSR